MAAKKKIEKRALLKRPKTPFVKARKEWVDERLKHIVRPPAVTQAEVKAWLLQFWDSTPRTKGMTVGQLKAAVEKRIMAQMEESKAHVQAQRRAYEQAPVAPYPAELPPGPPPPLPEYPAAVTPCGPGQLPRRVPVPANVTFLPDSERRGLTLALMQEETALEQLADWYRKQDAGPAAAQAERTIAAVRGDIIRLRFRDSLWAAIGHLERLAEMTPEPEGMPELESHLQRVDKALQAAVISIVQEMRGPPTGENDAPH